MLRRPPATDPTVVGQHHANGRLTFRTVVLKPFVAASDLGPVGGDGQFFRLSHPFQPMRIDYVTTHSLARSRRGFDVDVPFEIGRRLADVIPFK